MGVAQYLQKPSMMARGKYLLKRFFRSLMHVTLRMQIHVGIDSSGNSEIMIFSKSNRDSTLDRAPIHWLVLASPTRVVTNLISNRIIREALGLVHTQEGKVYAQRNVPLRVHKINSIVLEGEMVAYDKDKGIDGEAHKSMLTLAIDMQNAEFWRIRGLIDTKARSFYNCHDNTRYSCTCACSVASLINQLSAHAKRQIQVDIWPLYFSTSFT